MRKYFKLIGVIIFSVIIGFSLLGCNIDGDDEKDKNDTSIDDTRIWGIWTDTEGRKWTFGSNGKLTYENSLSDIRSYNFSFVKGKLSFYLTNNNSANDTWQTYDVSIINDGNTLILAGGKHVTGWIVAGPGMPSNQLSKI